MRSFIDFSKVRPQKPDLVWVKLHPETSEEKKILTQNSDRTVIESYYRDAITHKLPEYTLAGITDEKKWPGEAEVRVRKI